jgi:predicted outer membrane repeat protein
MHLKPARTAATAAAIGGALVLGLGSAQAAMANPVSTYHVPCSADALAYDLSHVSSPGTLFLTAGCTYYLPDGLTDNVDTLTIVGYSTTLRGGGPDSDYSILTVNCMKTLTLDGVNFTEGSAEDGGAIDNGGNLTVNGGVFSRNSGEYGAAIYSDGDLSTLAVNNAVFTGNDGEYGGAIYAQSDTSQTVTGAHFSQNKAEDGGAIYAEDDLTVADSTFLGNTAEDGGAIVNYEDLSLTNVTDVPGSGNTFTGNQATLGGAIYNGDWVGVGNSLIAFNAAHHLGGGIYNACSTTWDLSDSTIYGNVTDNFYYAGTC